MSRYTQRIDENTVIEYGFDRVPTPGYFYSIEQMKETPENRMAEVVEAGDTRRMMICHENEEQMNRSEILEVLREKGVNPDHIEAMAMDQPF